jgi:hypothetical protein
MLCHFLINKAYREGFDATPIYQSQYYHSTPRLAFDKHHCLFIDLGLR